MVDQTDGSRCSVRLVVEICNRGRQRGRPNSAREKSSQRGRELFSDTLPLLQQRLSPFSIVVL